MNKYITIAALLCSTALFSGQDSLNFSGRPFNHKLLYSETAEQSRKWAIGVRFNLAMPLQFPLPIPTTDLFVNINNWFDVDIVRSGWNELNVDANYTITDLFWTLGFRSRPYKTSLFNKPLNLSGGMKFFKSSFEMVSKEEVDTTAINDKSFVLYMTQTMALTDKHRINLFTSLSIRKTSGGGYYLIPGYTYFLNKRWSFNFEYYTTNSLRLPYKILQFTLDENNLDFFNSKREMVSFMFYGLTYNRTHLRIDLAMGNHISFSSPHILLVGAGWQF